MHWRQERYTDNAYLVKDSLLYLVPKQSLLHINVLSGRRPKYLASKTDFPYSANPGNLLLVPRRRKVLGFHSGSRLPTGICRCSLASNRSPRQDFTEVH